MWQYSWIQFRINTYKSFAKSFYVWNEIIIYKFDHCLLGDNWKFGNLVVTCKSFKFLWMQTYWLFFHYIHESLGNINFHSLMWFHFISIMVRTLIFLSLFSKVPSFCTLFLCSKFAYLFWKFSFCEEVDFLKGIYKAHDHLDHLLICWTIWESVG
jgi:hypothetical protein